MGGIGSNQYQTKPGGKIKGARGLPLATSLLATDTPEDTRDVVYREAQEWLDRFSESSAFVTLHVTSRDLVTGEESHSHEIGRIHQDGDSWVLIGWPPDKKIPLHVTRGCRPSAWAKPYIGFDGGEATDEMLNLTLGCGNVVMYGDEPEWEPDREVTMTIAQNPPDWIEKDTYTGPWDRPARKGRIARGTAGKVAELYGRKGVIWTSFGHVGGREMFARERYVANSAGDLFIYDSDGRQIQSHPADRELRVLTCPSEKNLS